MKNVCTFFIMNICVVFDDSNCITYFALVSTDSRSKKRKKMRTVYNCGIWRSIKYIDYALAISPKRLYVISLVNYFQSYWTATERRYRSRSLSLFHNRLRCQYFSVWVTTIKKDRKNSWRPLNDVLMNRMVLNTLPQLITRVKSSLAFNINGFCKC